MSDPYLTPERFRTAGTGIDLSEVEIVELRSAIHRATAKINTYCAVPTIPQGHSFRGGAIVGEEHIYPADQWERPRPFRLWPWHTPIRSVQALRLVWGVQGGNETFLDISPDNLLISDQDYLEVSSLNLSKLVFGDAVMPYIGLHQPIFRTSYSYGHRFTSIDEYVEPVDARTFQAQNQFWTDDAAEVKVEGVVQTTGFTINRREGWVVFDDMQDPDAEITASYTYPMPNDIQQACSLLVARDISEAQLRAKGMEGLVSIRVKDVELRRAVAARTTGASGYTAASMPSDAGAYLDGYVFRTAR